MTIQIEILSNTSAYAELRDRWNELVQDNPTDLSGLDATSTYEWFEASLAAFPEASESRVIVARLAGRIVGLLAIIIGVSAKRRPRLLAPTELFGGRNGPLLSCPDPAILEALLDGLVQACPRWISLQLTMVTHSAGMPALIEACKRKRYPIVWSEPQESPFFPLLESKDAFWAGISKDVRQRIGSGERKLAKLGAISYREYSRVEQAEELFDAVLAVERQSWKHQAGTAISNDPRQERFYRELFPRAMRGDLLHAQVLFIDEQPVAHTFGLTKDGVFISLKLSHSQSLDKIALNHLNRFTLIGRLREKNISAFDFMGLCEPYKLRWSNATGYYRRQTCLIFANTLRGYMAFLARSVANRIRSWQASRKTDQAISHEKEAGAPLAIP